MKAIPYPSVEETSVETGSGPAPALRFQWRRSIVVTLLIALFALAIPASASARDSAARKVGRGMANLTLGVLALPGEIMETTQERGPFVGATWGFAKGVGMLVAHELVGVFEVLTCPFETPPGFKPILAPEYPWGYFYEGRRQRTASRHSTKPRR